MRSQTDKTRFIFATNNKNKLEEAKAVLSPKFELLSPRDCGVTEDIPEDFDTLEENAVQKARYIYKKTGENCFADDTGLEVQALNGEPGVRSARYAGEGHDFSANTALLLKNLQGAENRRAQFRTVVALIYDGKEHLFEGVVKGEIIDRERGGEGFGYDPIFVPEGYKTTFAEMSEDEKNRISHRGIAMRKLGEFLQNKTKQQ